jgi:hypothetical protein
LRYTKFMIALLGLAATLYAADPFVATWKMNSAQTKYKVGAAPKEQTLVIGETGAEMTVTVAGVAADGGKISMAYSMPSAGGSGKVLSGPYDGITGKRISAHEREVDYLKGGKSVYNAHSKVSTDGKTLTVMVKGSNSLGQNVEGSVVYDKQ